MRRYIQSLDGIRGFGIFFVFLYHYLRLNDTDWSVMGFSWIWIQMFFVQSGYLITQILLGGKHQTFPDYARQFYWRRMLRIFPLYFAYVLAFAALYMVTHKPDDFGQRAPYLFTFTYNYTRLMPEIPFRSVWFIHFWSLAVEEQFYLVWPLLVYFISKENLKKLLLIIIAVVPFFRYWFASHVLGLGYSAEMTGEITYAFTLSQFDAFAIGAAIPVFNLAEKIKRPGKWVIWMAGIVLLAGVINFVLLRKIYPDFSITSLGLSVAIIDNLQHVWSYSLVNLLFMFVILYLIQESYKGIFNNKVLVNVGKIVFGLYILHFVILFAFSIANKKYVHNFFITFSMACLITYGLAYVSYNFYEKWFLQWKDFKWRRSVKKN